MNKRNTFTDFIACAEPLKKEGYTATERLWIEGGGAGRLLIGALLNLRPDLCRAAILKINLDAGHGGASGRYDYLREIAFDYAWVLKDAGPS